MDFATLKEKAKQDYGFSINMFQKKEFKTIAESISEDETVEFVSAGKVEGKIVPIVVTDTTIYVRNVKVSDLRENSAITSTEIRRSSIQSDVFVDAPPGKSFATVVITAGSEFFTIENVPNGDANQLGRML